jgi:hypothetical protein
VKKKAACYSGLKNFALLAIPAVMVMVVVSRIIGVIAMMVVVMMVAVVAMMIAVPSCGWHGAAGRDCANNS